MVFLLRLLEVVTVTISPCTKKKFKNICFNEIMCSRLLFDPNNSFEQSTVEQRENPFVQYYYAWNCCFKQSTVEKRETLLLDTTMHKTIGSSKLLSSKGETFCSKLLCLTNMFRAKGFLLCSTVSGVKQIYLLETLVVVIDIKFFFFNNSYTTHIPQQYHCFLLPSAS